LNLPWLAAAQEQLARAAEAGRLPAALLIHDAPGAGGIHLARAFAQHLLCEHSPRACGQCRSCRQVESGEHPDLTLVVPDPELKSGQLTVDQVRAVSAGLALSSHAGRGSCVVFNPADALNRQACNALLKTLEEPRASAHLVLLTRQPSRLPATVRSRCQVLRLAAPDRATAMAFLDAQSPGHRADWEAALEVLGPAPLEALEADRSHLRAIRDETTALLREACSGRLDIVRRAEQWAREDLPLRLRALELALTARVLAIPDTEPPAVPLSETVGALKIATALGLLDEVRELQRLLATPVNRSLALEGALWRLNAAVAADAATLKNGR
jgi:DNA polymerase III subunit delta'